VAYHEGDQLQSQFESPLTRALRKEQLQTQNCLVWVMDTRGSVPWRCSAPTDPITRIYHSHQVVLSL
jgi:hypothetical protein